MVSMETELAKSGYDAFDLSAILPSLTFVAVFLDIERWWCICPSITRPLKEERRRADTSFSHSFHAALHPHVCPSVIRKAFQCFWEEDNSFYKILLLH